MAFLAPMGHNLRVGVSMNYASILLVILFVSPPLRSSDWFVIHTVEGKPLTRDNVSMRLRVQLASLRIPQDDWRWLIIEDGPEWDRALISAGLIFARIGHRPTRGAFTYLEIRTTYINSWVLEGDRDRLRFIIAHEYAHRRTLNEATANRIAHEMIHKKRTHEVNTYEK